MPQSQARAWWADVQHVRDSIERRRADAERPPAPAPATGRFTRSTDPSPPALVDLHRPASGTARAGRFDRAPRAGLSAAVPEIDTDGPSVASARRADGAHAETQRPAGGALAAHPARRTVQITGRPDSAPTLPRLIEVERRRPPRRPVERIGARPDRVAFWAVLLAFFLVVVAAAS